MANILLAQIRRVNLQGAELYCYPQQHVAVQIILKCMLMQILPPTAIEKSLRIEIEHDLDMGISLPITDVLSYGNHRYKLKLHYRLLKVSTWGYPML